jgi:hypothetical protein
MGKRVLLVEGKDDEHVVRHLCKARGIDVRFNIEQVKGDPETDRGRQGEGIEYLLDQVPVRLRESDLERLAVLVDADTSAQSRWRQLRDRLRKAGHENVPDEPAEGGTIMELTVAPETVRVGIWIMPNNVLPGMLEDFAVWLVPEDDKMMPHVERFLGDIPREDRPFTDANLPKARIHSYLAVQKEPGRPLGLAVTARYLDAGKDVLEPFLAWLTKTLITDGPGP